MGASVREIVESYNPKAPLAEAWTVPAPWYVDPRIMDLERRTVFARSWQFAGRADQVREPGRYVTWEVAGEPIVVVRGSDQVLRGFFNVCRHHAAAVMTEAEGKTHNLRCPYHGWTYTLEGQLKGTPDFAGVCNFDRAANGLLPVETAVWENWVFVKLEHDGPSLDGFLGADLVSRVRLLGLGNLHWMERRHYTQPPRSFLFRCEHGSKRPQRVTVPRRGGVQAPCVGTADPPGPPFPSHPEKGWCSPGHPWKMLVCEF